MGPEVHNNRFEVAERIEASREEVFAVLTDVDSITKAHSPRTTSVQRLTCGSIGVGTRWRETRRALFLRETVTLEVVEFVRNEKYALVLDDGCNLVKYTFQLEAGPGNSTIVRCLVDCHMRLGVGWSGPSEKLARMIEKHDGPLLQRLKGYMETNSFCSVY